MKPKPKAAQNLQLIVDTQKTVSTNRIQDLVKNIIDENKMLRIDNHKLRRKIRRLRDER